jgi:hypothetical protein
LRIQKIETATLVFATHYYIDRQRGKDWNEDGDRRDYKPKSALGEKIAKGTRRKGRNKPHEETACF